MCMRSSFGGLGRSWPSGFTAAWAAGPQPTDEPDAQRRPGRNRARRAPCRLCQGDLRGPAEHRRRYRRIDRGPAVDADPAPTGLPTRRWPRTWTSSRAASTASAAGSAPAIWPPSRARGPTARSRSRTSRAAPSPGSRITGGPPTGPARKSSSAPRPTGRSTWSASSSGSARGPARPGSTTSGWSRSRASRRSWSLPSVFRRSRFRR